MLVLTRRVNEKIMIGDDIVVMVMGVNGNQVRLGIEAPDSTPIHREEIKTRIDLEKGIWRE